jgi:hypothetical protein
MKWIKKLILVPLFILIASAVQATTLSDLQPHKPTKKPWNEQWFYYFNDPLAGYYKISFQTFLYKNDEAAQERGYLHFVYTPLEGDIRTYDYIYDSVDLGKQENSDYGFYFNIPGIASINEKKIEITTEDFTFHSELTGEHSHYWKLNPGASPYSLIGELPFVANRWFTFSMGTAAEYRFNSNYAHHEGQAMTYIDKGWSTSQAANYAFVMATQEDAQLMLAGGSDEGLSIEMWAGRYLSENSNITFLPSLNGLNVKRVMKPCEGEMKISFKGLGRTLIVRAQADIEYFSDALVPSILVFDAAYPSAKTMNAEIEVEVYRWGQLIEYKKFDQGALEFGGGMHCNAQSNK